MALRNRKNRGQSPILVVLAFAAFSALAQHGPMPMHQRFDDAERWSKVFDDPERDVWQKPAEAIRALGLTPQAAVADLGAGTGYFATRLARALPQGRVYAVDLEPAMVRYLEERAAREGLKNLSAHLGAADSARLPDPVDLVLVVDTYHHIERRSAYFARLREALKPLGRVAIIDFKPDSPVGPPPRSRLAATQVTAEMEKSGYRLAVEHDFLPYQYFLVFTAAARP